MKKDFSLSVAKAFRPIFVRILYRIDENYLEELENDNKLA